MLMRLPSLKAYHLLHSTKIIKLQSEGLRRRFIFRQTFRNRNRNVKDVLKEVTDIQDFIFHVHAFFKKLNIHKK